jgi:virulence factor Mce-like protein
VRRTLVTVLVAALAAGAVVLALGASHGSKPAGYTVVLDNAFGLQQGGDLKIAGVRAGKITKISLDQVSHRALVQFRIDRAGFGSLRSDVHCASRPQSLIGEYFLDCDPGTAKKVLKAGARIPVTQSASTVAPDLLNDIMRRPYRQRLSIILGELGAGVAARGPDLNAAIRRASPALRETDRVLAILARQNLTLRDLVTNADRVIGDLAGNHKDVGRWVVEARDTARTSAQRRAQIAEGFRRLPGFLEQLRPTMASLGTVARNQAPALRNLDASSQQLEQFFTRLKPFADASRPAFAALAKASDTGDRAVKSAGPVIDQLASFSAGAPELGKNLAMILEHLDDPKYAVEKDPRSPGGRGYTGLEALLSYVYDQALSTNAFDSNVHYLKVAVDSSDCAHYADIPAAKKLEDKCAARLGPHALGFNFDDPTVNGDGNGKSTARVDHSDGGAARPAAPEPAPAPAAPADGGSGAGGTPSGGPATPALPGAPAVPQPSGSAPGAPAAPSLPLPGLPPVGSSPGSSSGTATVPATPVGKRLGLSARTTDTQSAQMLLDYLLGP